MPCLRVWGDLADRAADENPVGLSMMTVEKSVVFANSSLPRSMSHARLSSVSVRPTKRSYRIDPPSVSTDLTVDSFLIHFVALPSRQNAANVVYCTWVREISDTIILMLYTLAPPAAIPDGDRRFFGALCRDHRSRSTSPRGDFRPPLVDSLAVSRSMSPRGGTEKAELDRAFGISIHAPTRGATS